MHGGVSALSFQRGKMANALLEIAELITFSVSLSRTKRLQKQDEDRSGRCWPSRG